MSRYVYVNISQYFCRLYDRIWTDMHGMKRAMCSPIRAVTFRPRRAIKFKLLPMLIMIETGLTVQTLRHALFIAVNICVYPCICVNICAYLYIST